MRLNGSVSASGQDWMKRALPEQSYSPEYQELKFKLHRQLLDRINSRGTVNA